MVILGLKSDLTITTLHESRLRDIEAQRGSRAGQFASDSKQLFGPVALHHHHVKHRQVVPETRAKRHA